MSSEKKINNFDIKDDKYNIALNLCNSFKNEFNNAENALIYL